MGMQGWKPKGDQMLLAECYGADTSVFGRSVEGKEGESVRRRRLLLLLVLLRRRYLQLTLKFPKSEW